MKPAADTLTGKLASKVMIVTGGTQGVGADLCRGAAAAGARVVIAGRGKDAGAKLAAEIGELAHFVEIDVQHDADIDLCITNTLDTFGRIDMLVNNACIYTDHGLASSREQWHETLGVNLISAAIFAQKVSPHLSTGGVIINIGSTGGKFGAMDRALYPASKAAIQQFTRNLAVTLAPRGIRAVCVSPAWTWSPSLAAMSENSIERADRVGAALHPLGRVGRGEDIARAVVFLASEDAGWITGVDIPVDGGFSILGPDQGMSPRVWFAKDHDA